MQVNTQILIKASFLIVMEIIFSRFCSFTTPVVKIGFAFLPIAICGIFYGPFLAGFVGGVADIVGTVLFPVAGPFFPGFTISAILIGVVYGKLLNNKKCLWSRLIIAVLLNTLGVGLCINTFWMTLITDVPFTTLIFTRIIQTIIMIPVQILTIRTLQVRLHVFNESY